MDIKKNVDWNLLSDGNEKYFEKKNKIDFTLVNQINKKRSFI